MYLEGFLSVITDPEMYLVILLGVAVGIVFGAIPGLTATMAITMCLPMTYAMETKTAVCVLMALYIGGISGGLISAILLNIPGTPSSLATTFDGAPMAASGHAKKALGVGVFYSFIGTMVGLVILMGVAPQLSKIAIKFSPLEYCALAIFSLVLVIALAGKDMIKGLISGTLGLMFATVGLSPIDSMKRFTFGNVNLTGGFQLLTLLIGLYAITEIAAAAFEAVHPKDMTIRKTEKVKGFGFSLKEFKDNIGNMSISALIGTAIGILPGIGGGTAGLLAYSVEKSRSKHPEKYGTGCMEGVVASETSNNAVIGGAMVPLLTLGIPGDGATAMLLGGLMIHGVTTGPLIFQKYGDTVYAIYAAMLIAAVMMLFVEFYGMKGFVNVLKIPRNFLLPPVVAMCCIGAFGNANRVFDVVAVVIFGLVGYLLGKVDMPQPPLVLGFILGSMLETNLRRSVQLLTIDPNCWAAHPIAIGFLVATVIALFFIIRSRTKKPAKTAE